MTCPLISICLGHRIRRYELDLRTYFGTATRQLLREAPTGLNAVRGAMMESNKCQGAKTAIEDRADTVLTHWSCSRNFPSASNLDERTLTHEPIVKQRLHKCPYFSYSRLNAKKNNF